MIFSVPIYPPAQYFIVYTCCEQKMQIDRSIVPFFFFKIVLFLDVVGIANLTSLLIVDI